jgi:SPP1 family predicted phage head-tail adaptor
MIASELTEWIQIKKRTKAKNEFGIVEEVFTTYKTTKAKVNYRTSRENDVNNQLLPNTVIQFKIRYNTDIDETMLVYFMDKLYDIRAIEHNLRLDTFITVERSKL